MVEIEKETPEDPDEPEFDQATRHREKYDQAPEYWSRERYDALLAEFIQKASKVLETLEDCTSIIVFGSFARSFGGEQVWMHDQSNINIVPVFRQPESGAEITMNDAYTVAARLTGILESKSYVDAHTFLVLNDTEHLAELVDDFFHDQILIIENPLYGEDGNLRESLDNCELNIRYHTIPIDDMRE